MKKQTLGERVKLLRKSYSLTQAEFAREIGKSQLTVGNLERGVSEEVQPETLNNIIKRFGVTREWLIDGKGEMEPIRKLAVQVAPVDYTDEAWVMAKEQIKKKDDLLENLGTSFSILTTMLKESGISFLHRVGKTGS